MDNVLKYKFWILSGLVLVLALVGYFLANPAIKAATEEKISEIKGTSVQTASVNDSHTEVAQKLAAEQEQGNQLEVQKLDQVQRHWMNWPNKLIEDALERDANGQIVYRGTNLRKDDILYLFRQYYEQEMEALYYSVNPVVGRSTPYPSQNKVFLKRETVPQHQFFKNTIATIDQIWDAQEDYWLVKMLFEAINATNQSAQDVNSAPLREIRRLELFGGTGVPSYAGGPSQPLFAAAGGGGGMAGGGMSDMGGMMMPGGMMGGVVMFAGPGGGDVGGGGGGGVIGAPQVGFNRMMEYGASGAVAGAPDAFGIATASVMRYVGFDPANPGQYRRRGFYLSVIIDEKRIPDFIVNLNNLDPPANVGRWSFGNNPYDTDHLLTGGAFGGRKGLSLRARPNIRGRIMPRTPATGAKDPRLAALEAAANAEEVAEYQNALTSNKDLVQLDMAGVLTLFTPTIPAAPGTVSAEGVSPTDAAPPTATPAPVEAAPAPDVQPGEAAPAPEAATPSTPEAAPPAETPAAAPPAPDTPM